MKKLLIGCLVLALGVIGLVFVGLAYVGTAGTETWVVTGRQMRKGHLETIRELGLLEQDEEIQFFYSDALIDIRAGMYFVTDRNLVLYCEEWDDPQLVVPFSEVSATWLEADDSFFMDSYVGVVLEDDTEWAFPVSSEKGMDQRFYDYLEEKRSAAFADPGSPGSRGSEGEGAGVSVQPEGEF